jgi:hypothetical protein
MRRFHKAAGAGGYIAILQLTEKGDHSGQNEQQIGDGNAAVVECFSLT